MLAIVLLGYALLGVYEFVPLFKEKRRKEFYVNLGLGIISFAMAILISLKVDIPSPAKPVEIIIESIFGK